MKTGGIAPTCLTFVLDRTDCLGSRPGHFTVGDRDGDTQIDRRLGGPQRLSGGCRGENFLPPSRTELQFLHNAARSFLAKPTEPSRLTLGEIEGRLSPNLRFTLAFDFQGMRKTVVLNLIRI
jgi:hypothetical protein